MQVLTGGRLFDGKDIVENSTVHIEKGRITAVGSGRNLPAGAEIIDLNGGLLAPGFIDVQVNGGGGVLFNDTPELGALKTISGSHRRFGTTSLLPTLISDDFQVMTAAAAAIRLARRQHLPGVIGVHFEGPYLNVARKGVHDPAKIRPFEEQAKALFGAGDLGSVVVTLAPELCSPGLIRSLTDAGVRVCAGHTAGTYDDMQQALAEGLAGFTHLFNAMTPLQGRAPGVVGAALEDAQSWCGIIADGRHVHAATLKVAIAAKAKGKMMLVSDAMPTVGSPDSTFVLAGDVIEVRDGVCVRGDGTLAGSDLDMAAAVRNAVNLLGQPLEEALRMASLYPAAFLGLADRLGSVRAGYQADLVLLDDRLRVTSTWIAGQRETHA